MRRFSFAFLSADRRGVAAIEFALWSLLIFGALVPALDFGLYLLTNAKLSGAVGQASMLTYNMRNASNLDVGKISSYVTAASGLPADGVVVSVTCNGGAQDCSAPAASRVCACVSDGPPISYLPTSTCGAPCASGATSGFYVSVGATSRYRSVVKNPWLDGSTMSNVTTVRLQ
ncbi:TadE/TadG family type IV pilus assembly protein [Sphingomonas sp. Marseille-Q8236]